MSAAHFKPSSLFIEASAAMQGVLCSPNLQAAKEKRTSLRLWEENSVLPGKGFSSFFEWNFPPSPSPGCSGIRIFSSCFFCSVRFSLSSSTGVISIFAASAIQRVSSYPFMRTSTGSPIGAYFTVFTVVHGIIPMSRKCCLSAPVPPTEIILADLPVCSSLSFIFIRLF